MTENTENFEALLDQSLKKIKNFEGKVVNGKVISIDHNHALIDVGLKSEGRITIDELRFCDKEKEIKVGDKIDVFVERLEDKNGEAVLSREKAKKESAFVLFDEILKKINMWMEIFMEKLKVDIQLILMVLLLFYRVVK